MVRVALHTEDGQRLELEISEQDHVFWQVAAGATGPEEQGYLKWSELETDLAEGMSGVGQRIVEAVQVWRDNFMIACPKSTAA
ncbi:MAG: hypothetical protein ABFD97_12500 [Syntrophobacter sp.]